MGTKVNANPTKEFFISMLTRDVDLRAAILELIDNSIDGAKRLRPDGNYNGLWVRLKFDKSSFEVCDNCGGIPIKVATEYAFRFGRPDDRPVEVNNQYFSGAFGIGMKRSLFRLGNIFSINSSTQNEHFLLNVDVKQWLSEKGTDWSFQLEKEEYDQNNDESHIGTTIKVSSLNANISKQLNLEYFKSDLIRYIENFRTTAVENGLQIFVNDILIEFIPEKICSNSAIIPYVNFGEIDSVSYTIIAGLAPKGQPEKAGWYIYCNGRLVVYADKTRLSGWGEEPVRQYHPSLAPFRGFVLFESTKSGELPWNTSKTSVDSSSPVYIGVKPIMQEATYEILKSCFSADNEDLVSDVLSTINSTDLIKLTTSSIKKLTTKATHFSFIATERKDQIPMANITFQKPEAQIKHAKEKLKVSTNKDVGLKAFEYFYERECSDDE